MSPPDLPPPPPPKGEAEAPSWVPFTHNLATGLGRMQAEQSLVLAVAEPRDASGDVPNYFVRFAPSTSEFHAEAVSNRFLPDRWRLTELDGETLFTLGWHAPDEEHANYHREWAAPAPFAEIAQMAVSTLRRVYKVGSPDELRYDHSDVQGQALELQDLGLRRVDGGAGDPAVAKLRPMVEEALRKALNSPQLAYDEQGDIPVRFGSAMVFVRLLGGETPKVLVFSPLLWDVRSTDGLLEALNDINQRIEIGRVFWTGTRVVAAIELPAPGLSPDYVALSCFQIGSLADHFDETLAERFGGRTAFGASEDAQETSERKPPMLGGYL